MQLTHVPSCKLSRNEPKVKFKAAYAFPGLSQATLHIKTGKQNKEVKILRIAGAN
jgi:hypothetical protein